MTRRIFCKVLLVVVAIFGLLVLSGVLLAQGRSEEALERAKEVQERNTNRLMAMDGVEGTAIGFNQNNRLAVKVFTAGPGVRGIPQELDGVPVQVVVTGKFYALAPSGIRGKPPKDPTPPAPPTNLTATAVSSSQINLVWTANTEDDLSHYRVYRSDTGEADSYSRIASRVRSSAYSDTGLAAGTTYYYVVTAVDRSKNESENSVEASATTEGGPVEPPDKPPLWCERPVPIGVSTGHPAITAGTIGCRVTDGTNVYALSNNHVYANQNKASNGDAVIQPGTFDGGSSPADDIGTLSAYVPIDFDGGDNIVDAAIALSNTDLLGNATPSDGYGTPSSTTTAAFLRQTVQKYGRTTRLTSGRIAGVNATVNVGYDSGTARFVSQIVIRGGGFSAGGDSGSLIVTQSGNNPVGLLFAGSSSMTVANPIDAVLSRFGVTVDGE